MHEMQLVAPVEAWKVPAAQGLHAAEEAELMVTDRVPAPQPTQLAAPFFAW